MTRRERALQRAETLLRREDCRALAIELNTLLPLPLWQESDLYALMEQDVRRAAKMRGPIDFPLLRGEARGRTLEEVYDHLSSRLVGANVRSLAQRERELRMRLPVLMADVQQLLTLAKSLGKRTLVYDGGMSLLTNEDVRDMLLERGAALPDDLYIDHWTGELHQVGTLTLGQEKARASWRHITVPSPVEDMRRCHGDAPASAWLGWRAMTALSAMRPGGELGMYLLGNSVWLADECCRSGVERVAFVGQPIVRQAFEQICEALALPVTAVQAEISERSAMPLHFRHPNDLLHLPAQTDWRVHTARTLLDLFAPVVDIASAASIMNEWGFLPNELLTETSVVRFIDVFRTRLFDGERFAAYRERAKKHLAPLCAGRSAVFCAPEDAALAQVLADLSGADMPVYMLHTMDSLPDRLGLDHRALCGQTPAVHGAVQAYLLADGTPPCLRYGARGPVPEDTATERPEALVRMQEDALSFVQEMADLFGPDLALTPFRPADACAPFERFLQTVPPKEMSALCADAALCRRWQAMQCAGAGEKPLRIRLRSLRLCLEKALLRPFTPKKRRQ